MANKRDDLVIELACDDVSGALDRGLEGRQPDGLSRSVPEAIGQLTTTLATIRKEAIKKGKRNIISRILRSKDAITSWKLDFVRTLQVFDTELSVNNHVILSDIRRHTLACQASADSQHQSTQASVSAGELPPPAPRACLGREELIEKVVGMAVNLKPIALIGAGGIGKTSIALKVLHDSHIKERFGDNRRFVRCDQFPASCTHFLARLSKVIGAGVENPEDMTPLRPFLSSKAILIVLDNAEAILDPQGTNHKEIYAAVDELCRFETVSLLITSRITTVPQYCERPQIPTLSMGAACDIFYSIYKISGRSGDIGSLLQRLDFHALSITLLATTASQNVWDHERLAKEWDVHHAQVLRADHNESLAATIELSLASPTFCKLGPNARDLLEVVAFFPQGIGEKNLDWLFPTISDRQDIFDKFCVLSLTYRCNGFITMLAPIRDYLCPREPKSSPLLCATKNSYFNHLSVGFNTNEPRLKETQWIVSEDVNVEHLLDVFPSTDGDAPVFWDACINFINHLYRQKPRQTVLRTKIEDLPDDHPSKAQCLFVLSRLSRSVGNKAEQRRLLTHTLELGRKQGDDCLVAQTLRFLSRTGSPEEGIQQTKEALRLFERLGDTIEQAKCLGALAWLLLQDGQLAAAEVVALQEIDLLQDKGEEFMLYRTHCLLGQIYHTSKQKDKAIHHFETALELGSRRKAGGALFWIYYFLSVLFRDEDDFDNANANIKLAKSHTGKNDYKLGRGTYMQACIWYRQRRLEEASSEARRALEIFESLGAAKDAAECRKHLPSTEEAVGGQLLPGTNPGGSLGAAEDAVECRKLLRDIEEAAGSQLLTRPDSGVSSKSHLKPLKTLMGRIGRKSHS